MKWKKIVNSEKSSATNPTLTHLTILRWSFSFSTNKPVSFTIFIQKNTHNVSKYNLIGRYYISEAIIWFRNFERDTPPPYASKKSQKINFYLNEFTGYNDIKPLTPHNSHSIYYTIYLLYFRWATTGFIHSWRDKLNDHRECFAASFFWVCLRAVVADFFLAFFSFSFGCFDQLTKWKICFAVFYNSQTLFDF